MKKFLAILLAAMMLLATAGVAFADGEDEGTTTTQPAGTFKIKAPASDVTHTYKVYQIFTGSLDASNTVKNLGDLKWGENANLPDGVKVGDLVTEAQLADLKGLTDEATDAQILTEVLKLVVDPKTATPMTTVASGNTIYVEPGYYLITDSDTLDNVDDVATTHLVQVVYDLTVAPKDAKPTVDKQVWDEPADAENGATDGWGETADHEINEPFQFKLIATLAADKDYAAYETYKVVFTDTMSKGVTFDSIASVKVDGVTVPSGRYATTATAGLTAAENEKTASWTLTIEDIKIFAEDVTVGEGESATTTTKKVDLTDGAVIEVIYNAHLNENADVNEKDGSTTNENSVELQYSNNPYSDGLGKTGPDSVWVYTFQIDNTKYKNAMSAGNELPGAGFTLYAGTGESKTVVKLIDNEDGTYTVAKQDAAEGTFVTEMVSNDNGKFDIKGLDAGTYTLEETTVPAGYNKCDDIVITIGAVHEENTDGTNTTTLEIEQNDKTYSGSIINLPGATLPETGGIGTTLFYMFGGIMAAGSALMLVVRRRADAEEE